MVINLFLTKLGQSAGNGPGLMARVAGPIVFVTIFLCVPSVFGQTDYSDAWIDDSNPNAFVIVAAGVTDNDYSADFDSSADDAYQSQWPNRH
jgi:hypothetical protein